MKCRNCGVELKEHAKFCNNCGTKVEQPLTAVPVKAVPVPAPEKTKKAHPAAPVKQPVPVRNDPPKKAANKKTNTGVILSITFASIAVILLAVLLVLLFFSDGFRIVDSPVDSATDTPTSITTQTGWQEIAKETYYFDETGTAVTGWREIDGKQYYFDETGIMYTGKQTIDGKTYYFRKTGEMYLCESKTTEYDEEAEEQENATISHLNIRETYSLGESLSEERLHLVVEYSNGKREHIPTGFTYSPAELTAVGTQQLTVTYGEITQTFDVEVLDFFEHEAEVRNISGEGYNENEKVNWVLYTTVRYYGNYTGQPYVNTTMRSASGIGSDSIAWENAKNGGVSCWYYENSRGGLDEENYYGFAYCLPDVPNFAGNYSTTFYFDGLEKTVTYTLVYNGDYDAGTGWSITNVNWS